MPADVLHLKYLNNRNVSLVSYEQTAQSSCHFLHLNIQEVLGQGNCYRAELLVEQKKIYFFRSEKQVFMLTNKDKLRAKSAE
jgi:hypothetical protein